MDNTWVTLKNHLLSIGQLQERKLEDILLIISARSIINRMDCYYSKLCLQIECLTSLSHLDYLNSLE